MTGMFLTPREVAELVGCRRRDAQARALRGMGIEHKVRPDGTVVVLRSHVEKVLGGEVGGGGRIGNREPDFSGMKA